MTDSEKCKKCGAEVDKSRRLARPGAVPFECGSVLDPVWGLQQSDKCAKTQIATLTAENTLLAGTVDDVHWALWKLDDKPHQAWTRLMAIAQEAGDTDGTEACRLMLALDMTPERIVELAGIVRAVGTGCNAYMYDPEGMCVMCCTYDTVRNHDPDCPIGQAEAWVAEHPVETIGGE